MANSEIFFMWLSLGRLFVGVAEVMYMIVVSIGLEAAGPFERLNNTESQLLELSCSPHVYL